MPRFYWKLWGIKNPETIAAHVFTLAIMAWIFGKEKKEINLEKLLKMALCHKLPAIYTGKISSPILNQDKKERILKKESKALEKLIKKLNFSLKKEIFQLWQQYRLKSSPEALFLNELDILANLLQCLFYEKKFKKFSASFLWKLSFKSCKDPLCLSLLKEMKNFRTNFL